MDLKRQMFAELGEVTRATLHPRVEHVDARHRRARRGQRPAGAGHRPPLLQPGQRDEAARDRPRARDERQRRRDLARARPSASARSARWSATVSGSSPIACSPTTCARPTSCWRRARRVAADRSACSSSSACRSARLPCRTSPASTSARGSASIWRRWERPAPRGRSPRCRTGCSSSAGMGRRPAPAGTATSRAAGAGARSAGRRDCRGRGRGQARHRRARRDHRRRNPGAYHDGARQRRRAGARRGLCLACRRHRRHLLLRVRLSAPSRRSDVLRRNDRSGRRCCRASNEYRARFGDYWRPAPLLERLVAEGRGVLRLSTRHGESSRANRPAETRPDS